jgi:hypothetical protein
LRPLNLGEMLDEGLALYRANAKLFLSVVLVPAILTGIIWSICNLAFINSIAAFGTGSKGPTEQQMFQFFGTFVVVTFVAAPIIFLLWAYQQTGLTVAVADRYLNNPATGASVRKRLHAVFGRVIGAYLLLGLIFGALVAGISFTATLAAAGVAAANPALSVIPALLGCCFIVPCVMILLVFSSFLGPAIVVEDLGVSAALARCWKLTMSDFWRALGIVFVVSIVSGILSMIVQAAIQLPFSLFGMASFFSDAPIKTDVLNTALQGLMTLLQSSASALILPFSVGVTALLYFDVRIRKEGFDIEMLAKAMAPGGDNPGFML